MERASDDARRIDRLMRWGTVTGEDDGRLLERFRHGRDESAFAALVDRHGPMVLGVCRRILRDDRDVEDAFQATFLVLVRRAGTIRGADRVGPWIHGVAHRVAVRARADAARRYVREGADLDAEPAVAVSSGGEAESSELRSILDEELSRLPERLRAPLILCHLEGLTHEQAATRLQQPVGTIRSRLSRGRDRLRDRMTRRGFSAEGVPASIVLAEPVPSALLEAAVRSSLAFASSRPDALASAGAAVLASGVLDAMIATKMKIAAVALGTMLALGSASGYALQEGTGGKAQVPVADRPGSTPPKGIDRLRLEAEQAKAEAALEDLKSKRDQLDKEIEVAHSVVARNRRLLKERDTQPLPNSPPPAQVGAADAPSKPAANAPLVVPGPFSNASARNPFTRRPFDGANYIASSKLVIVPSKNGHVVTGYSTETGEAKSIQLADDEAGGITVAPIVGMTLAALQLKGGAVDRIAVFSVTDGVWHPKELAEPAGEAIPIIGPAIAVYCVGRRIYAFSVMANRWDVLELPKPLMPGEYPSVNAEMVTYLSPEGGRLHIFGAKTGKWTSIEVERLPQKDEPQPKAVPAQ